MHWYGRVCLADQRGAVGYQEHCLAGGVEARNRFEDGLFGGWVQVGGRFIQDHQRRIAVERAGQRQPLTLAHGQANPALAN
jgi:hypothetical protein